MTKLFTRLGELICISLFFYSCNSYYIDDLCSTNVPLRVSSMKDFGVQPAADGSTDSFADSGWDYNQLINNIYEPMRIRYPQYIYRESLGNDSSGEFEIYSYTFEPKYYQQSIILISGVHANEEDAVMCLSRIMQLIAESDTTMDDDLIFLRQNVKITVIPVVNVWGFSQKEKQRLNSQGESLQQWDSKHPIKEILGIRNMIAEMADEVSFIMDMHTTTLDEYRDFYGIINKNDKNVRTIFRTVGWLCDNYAIEGDVNEQYVGTLEAPYLLSTYFHNEYGLTTSTMELSDYHWDSQKSTSKVISMGVTMYLNYIIQQANDGYLIIHDIPNEDYRVSKP